MCAEVGTGSAVAIWPRADKHHARARKAKDALLSNNGIKAYIIMGTGLGLCEKDPDTVVHVLKKSFNEWQS